MSSLKHLPLYKRKEAIRRVRDKINKEVHASLKKDYENGFMNEKFNKIMELKIRWELGEISKECFVKFTRNHVIDCWAFKFMNKKKDISAVKIQNYWRKYQNKKKLDIKLSDTLEQPIKLL